MKITKHLKSLFLMFLFATCLSQAFAQKKYFIYIQAEDKQPFYITVNSKNYSSTVNGHLVIPKLKNGKYFFVAGFPKDKYPEQKFTCVVEDKDQGFVLKQFGTDGWGLFNLISFTKIMSNPVDWEKDKVVNDTTKIEEDYTVAPAKHDNTDETTTAKTKEEPVKVQPAKKTEEPTSTATAVRDTVKPVITTATTKTENTKSIIRTYQKGGSLGIDEIYVDYTANPTDTIAIFIPAHTVVETVAATEVKKDTGRIKNPGKTSQYNTLCVHLAEEGDFDKTRKLMSEETTDDKMIQSAKKSFSSKCYNVEQIKNLGLLFLSEQNRLKFFTMAKPYVYDRLNYPSLENQFTLSAVIDQFRKSLN
jgi:hypothetical protein